MRSILLDTNAYASLCRGNEEILTAIDRCREVFMSAIVLGELHDGFRGGTRYGDNMRQLQNFLSDPVTRVIPVTEETAEVFGIVKQQLREAGTPIPMNDVWIASHCLELGSILISLDQHFRHVPGLRVWRPE